jgi:predicted transcriptional regulator
MVETSIKSPAPPDAEPAVLPAERDARAASIVRARAQAAAGETVDGEAVYEWLESWGTANELPPPSPAPSRS